VFVCLLMKFCACWVEKYLIKIGEFLSDGDGSGSVRKS
jgi:hypothetical protein